MNPGLQIGTGGPGGYNEFMNSKTSWVVLVSIVAVSLGCDPITNVRGRVRFTPQQADAAQGKEVMVEAVRFPRPAPGCRPQSGYPSTKVASAVVRDSEFRFQFDDLGRHDWQFVAAVDGARILCLSPVLSTSGGELEVDMTCEMPPSCVSPEK